MESDRQFVLEKSKKRFEVLKFIYKDTNGQLDQASVMAEISQGTGIEGKELIYILEYLQNQGLIYSIGSLYGGQLTAVQILHAGILEIEAAITKPDEATTHFPAQIFNISNNAPVSAQQFGNQNTLNVSQQSNLAEAAAEIQQLLKQLEQSYPTTTLVEKAVVAEKAIQQIESNPTFKSKVVSALTSAGKEAFKEAVDHPLVNILVAGIEGWQEKS